MREYKFRGRDEHGVWHYGYLANIRLQSVPRWDSPTVIRFAEIVDEDDLTNRVDPETVGQCSELPDCDGHEIYEGDIIESAFAAYRALVAFRDGMFVATWGPNTAYQALYGVLRLKGLRVIGNIYDNPSLLEGTR